MGSRVLEMGSVFLLLVLFFSWAQCGNADVEYDHRSLIVNGKRSILISGSIHYPRSTPEMWPDLIAKAKEGGLDAIETYVFWNGHEPQKNKYNFKDRYDLVKFIKLVHKAELYVILRIGPYVCAEWNFGGFPVWLKYIPGISFRTNNEPFKVEMEIFTRKIVKMMKDENLFETQGGPIILSQIENEYGPLEDVIGAEGKRYAKWAANMSVGLNTGVPWIMCKQEHAPDHIINTCNGFYCHGFSPESKNVPKIWTEAWTGWFTAFGSPVPYRPVQDLAFSVALFVRNGGSVVNYYMYHGGTNFGRTAGGPFIATSYDYDAPLDEYGLKRQPKWGHLQNLHEAIKLCESALVSGDPKIINLGNKYLQEAHVFYSGNRSCAAFLTNFNKSSAVNVTFQNMIYTLHPWSVSILQDCKSVIYNTAEIKVESTTTKMTPVLNNFKWKSFSEVVASKDDKRSFTKNILLDQLNTTRDKTDYLWYTTEVKMGSSEGSLNIGNNPFLTVFSAGDALYVFINGELSGFSYGSIDHPKFNFTDRVALIDGVNNISLLSVAVGLPNIGKFFEQRAHGVYGVSLGGTNLGNQNWTYKIGMDGEYLSLYSKSDSSPVPWVSGEKIAKRKPLTWYKATFRKPSGNETLALDMDSMSKGQVWINGKNIGRYWNANKASGNCIASTYASWFHENKCLTGCGQSSQRWYHVPLSWLKSTRNYLVVFEEWGGNPTGISLAKRQLVESV